MIGQYEREIARAEHVERPPNGSSLGGVVHHDRGNLVRRDPLAQQHAPRRGGPFGVVDQRSTGSSEQAAGFNQVGVVERLGAADHGQDTLRPKMADRPQ